MDLFDCETRIVGEEGADSYQYRVAQRADGVCEPHRLRPAQTDTLPLRAGDTAVDALGVAQHDEGPTVGSPEIGGRCQAVLQIVQAAQTMR